MKVYERECDEKVHIMKELFITLCYSLWSVRTSLTWLFVLDDIVDGMRICCRAP